MYNNLNIPSAHPSYSHYYLLSPSTLFFLHILLFFAHLIVLHILLFCTFLFHCTLYSYFRVSPAILKTFYSGAIESVLTQCISVWYGNSSNQDCKALQRVVRLAERISGSALPSLQEQAIYIKRCKSRAAKIIKDSTHHLFCLLPSGKRFRSMMAKTERLRRSFFPQAIRLLNSNSVLINIHKTHC